MENKKNIYDFYRNNALLITKIRRAVELYRRQLYGTGGVLFAKITEDLQQIDSFPQFLDSDLFQKEVYNIISSLHSEDYVLCADYLEQFIFTILLPLQQKLFDNLKEYISDIYEPMIQATNGLIDFGETSCGYTTLLYHSSEDLYLCSTNDPMMEAYSLADEVFSPEIEEYHIWGLGLGYHAYALYQITNESADIYVYDNDHIMFELALSGKLGPWQSVFKTQKFHFVLDDDITKFSSSHSREHAKLLIHMPSLRKLPETNSLETERKTILKKFQITLNSFSEQKKDLYINFYKNIKNADGYAEELFSDFKNQVVIIIAAGPSLDKNIKELKKVLDNGTCIKVICVGTVFKKVIKEGIIPDVFFVMDPEKRTYVQIEGVEQQSVPLIINTSAYYELSQNYQGKKYIACQKDFELSEKLGHKLFNTGGSVTTLALDFAIQAKARKIIMLGCDMAFTGNLTHAEGTAQRHSTKDDKVIYVKGYYGDVVASGLKLSMYRKWIETRIIDDDAKEIEFINSTEGGAFIEGMIHSPLKESLNL